MKIGENLKGTLDTYLVTQKLCRNVWRAKSVSPYHTSKACLTVHSGSIHCNDFVIKTAPPQRLRNEEDILRRFQSCPYIRRLVDKIEDPPCLVLEHLHDNVLAASNSKTLARQDIKFVARSTLEALQVLHETGYVHTDIKPDNLLVRLGRGQKRFSEVKLADLGDTYRVQPDADPKEEGHVIGAAIFRSPEAMLNLRWGTPTDIWSFGATLISLIWGGNWHIFKPDSLTPDDEDYPLHVLIKQARFFGPFPLSYLEIADGERLEVITDVTNYVEENGGRKPFSMAEDKELTTEDRDFICRIMKLDPRDRPTAKQLLADKWFDSP